MEKAKIVAVFGKTGTGKTYSIKKFLTGYKGSFIVWDFYEEYVDGMIFDRFDLFIEYIKKQIQNRKRIKAIVRLPEEDFNKLCETVKIIKGVLFVIEELGEVSDAGHAPENLQTLIRGGRHLDIELIATSQRPADVPRLYTSQATDTIIFKIDEPVDLKYLRRYARVDPNKIQNQSVEKHECVKKKL